uniref:Uncharacterized protein n=1 Tax=Arundo donax TaxID=35708 RepID=A0A0A9BX30_ARUDO
MWNCRCFARNFYMFFAGQLFFIFKSYLIKGEIANIEAK